MGKLFAMRPPLPLAQSAADANEAGGNPGERGIDFTPWLSAPKERTPAYVPVFSSVATAMQSAMRRWVRDALYADPAIFERRVAAYSLLVFSCTRPFRGRTTNLFTYDIQQTATLDLAFKAAARMLRREIEPLDSAFRGAGGAGLISLRPVSIENFVLRNYGPLFRMFRVETALMDELLKFTQINIPSIGLEKAVDELRAGFRRHLNRFCDEIYFSQRGDELLRIATDALIARVGPEQVMPLAA